MHVKYIIIAFTLCTGAIPNWRLLPLKRNHDKNLSIIKPFYGSSCRECTATKGDNLGLKDPLYVFKALTYPSMYKLEFQTIKLNLVP